MLWFGLFEASLVDLPCCYDVWMDVLFAGPCLQAQAAHSQNPKLCNWCALCAMHFALNECNDARYTDKNDTKYTQNNSHGVVGRRGSLSRDSCATTAHVTLRGKMKHVHACVNNEMG